MARMVLFFSVALCLIRWSFASTCTEIAEPCYLYHNVEIPYWDTRHPDIPFSAAFQEDHFCDKYALNSNTWYRSGYNMTTQVVDPQSCGTDEPIWLNGTIPGPEDGIVRREACVRSYSETCRVNYTVYIRNCQYYTVYCFHFIPYSCQQRYCFDVNLTAITSTTTTTTTTTSTTLPLTTVACTSASPGNNCQPAKETRDSNEGLGKNGLAAAMLTLCACIVAFGTLLVIVAYTLRRDNPRKGSIIPSGRPPPYDMQNEPYKQRR